MWRREDEGGPAANFRGVVRCASVWACPMCSMAIKTERGKLLVEAVDRWRARGGAVLLVTGTVRHYARHRLRDVVTGVQGAARRLRQRRGWRRTLAEVGYVGDVRALEVTHGRNGWHPHWHALVFVAGSAELDGLEAVLSREWSQAVAAELGEEHRPNAERGLDVRRADRAGEYLAKLGCEIADPGRKEGRGDSRTPFQVAHDAGHGDERSIFLWREYTSAMKGKKFLNWSQGENDLRALLDLNEKTDEEVVEGEDAGGELVALIPAAAWDGGLRDHGLEILELAERGAYDEIPERRKPP